MRRWLRLSINLIKFPFAYLSYKGNLKTKPWAYQVFVQLFCDTGGRFNDLLSFFIGLGSKRIKFNNPSSVLGNLSKERLSKYKGILEKKGYLIFPNAVPLDMCDRLLKFAIETPALVRRMDFEKGEAPPRYEIFNPISPLATRYDYTVNSLLAQEDIQELICDPTLLSIAQEYLGSRPIVDVLTMWWHTNFQSVADSEAAQYYHFDLDRIKWLKVFIYITDVGINGGPHSFIDGSHRSGGIPRDILKRGYVRIDDEDVLDHYGAARQIEFIAPRGTIIIEDTRGLHKGKAVTDKESRLVLQMQFSNSLFGANYKKYTLPNKRIEKLQDMIDHAPDIFVNYL